mgnify:CR=1 FL=1
MRAQHVRAANHGQAQSTKCREVVTFACLNAQSRNLPQMLDQIMYQAQHLLA